MTRETIDRLLDSPVGEDVIIGINLAYKSWTEEEFTSMTDRIFNTNVVYPGYVFRAYDKLYVLFGSCILDGLNDWLFTHHRDIIHNLQKD